MGASSNLALLEKVIEDMGFYIYPNDDSSFSFGDSLKRIEIYVSTSSLSAMFLAKKIESDVLNMMPESIDDLDLMKIFLNHLKDLLIEERLGVTREIQARINQHRYRQKMLELWNGCAVTGILNTDFIVASHAKPYSMCNSNEADDKYNGLPLLIHLDRLFDQGYIAFEKENLIISPKLDTELVNLWNLKSLKLQKVIHEVDVYLKWHRENIFLK